MSKIFTPLAAAAAVALASNAAIAADHTFSYKAHELQTESGIVDLYNRIENRAKRACTSIGVRPLYVREAQDDCTSQLIDEYVASIGDARLTAFASAAEDALLAQN